MKSLPKWMQLNGATTAVTLVAAGGMLFAISPETVVTAFDSSPAATAPASPGTAVAMAPVEEEPVEEEPAEEGTTTRAGDADGSRAQDDATGEDAGEVPGDDAMLAGQGEEEPQEPITPEDLEDSGLLREEVESRIQSMRSTAATGAPYDFMLTQFNILGSNHTRPGSNADHFAPGGVRTEWAVSYLERWGSDVIGFSEIQKDQLAVFHRSTGGAFDAWPGTALGGVGVPQTLVWRKSMFTATAKESVTIPFMGQRRPQPVVRLKHNETGRELWVVNVHNAPRGREAERDQATALELAVINELRKTGLPVLFVGDMNEKEEIFCAVTGRTDLYSPRGGSRGGACKPPKGMRVDWIFGSSDVQFTGYTDEKTAEVRRITDHGVLHSRVTVP